PCRAAARSPLPPGQANRLPHQRKWGTLFRVASANMATAKITALGCYVPPRLLTNQDLEKLVETSDEWIVSRTGIRERHIAAPDMATSDMAVNAARCALAQRGVEASDLNTIIVCTVTPDYLFPSTYFVRHNMV